MKKLLTKGILTSSQILLQSKMRNACPKFACLIAIKKGTAGTTPFLQSLYFTKGEHEVSGCLYWYRFASFIYRWLWFWRCWILSNGLYNYTHDIDYGATNS